MIAHDQTLFGTDADDATPGNCTQAAIASLLDLPLEQVPHFALFGDEWGNALTAWLRSQGKRLRVYNDYTAHQAWWREHHVDTVAALNRAPSNQMMLAAGQSHNGPWQHIVLWKAGRLVHDTHPSRLGLDGPPYEYWQITDATTTQEPTS
jgi:hypothetical protein